jgi:hypothetical protein
LDGGSSGTHFSTISSSPMHRLSPRKA